MTSNKMKFGCQAKRLTEILVAFATVCCLTNTSLARQGIDSVITYQGQLEDNGALANGDFVMSFALFESEAAGTQAGPTLIFDGAGGNPPVVNVVNGVFVVQLDFGAMPYAENAALWLEITVSGTILHPRQQLTSAPHSQSTRGIQVDIDGNISGRNGAAIGNNSFLGLGEGTYPGFDRVHDFSHRITDFSSSSLWSPMLSVATMDPAVDLIGSEIYGNSFELHSDASSDKDVTLAVGIFGGTSHRGSGTLVNSSGGLIVSTVDGAGNIANNFGLGVNAGAGFGGQGSITNNYGVSIQAGHPGVGGSISNNYGLHIQSPVDTQLIDTNYGIFIDDQSVAQTTNYSIYSEGGNVYFNGDLDVTGSLSKGGGSFKIDHPLEPKEKYLLHSFVESPDMMNIYNGNVETDESGYASIAMPEWFEALNHEFRYQLTVIDKTNNNEFVLAKVVREIDDNRFKIRTSAGHTKVSWQVTGVRHDPWAKANRIPVELDKDENESGRYLHPESYGMAKRAGNSTGAKSHITHSSTTLPWSKTISTPIR